MKKNANKYKKYIINQFTNAGFPYLNKGFSHLTFLNGNKVWKVSFFDGTDFNSKKAYEIEKNILSKLLSYGFSTVKVYRIISFNKFVKGLFGIEECKVNGKQYNINNISREAEKEIFHFICKLTDIKATYFQNFSVNNKIRKKTWINYLNEKYIQSFKEVNSKTNILIDQQIIKNLIYKTINYSGSPCFLIMDSNVENYFFDENDKIISVIDIDHPIFGDPFYQLVYFNWNYKNLFRNYYELNKNSDSFLIYKYLIAVDDLSFRISHELNYKFIQNKVKKIQQEIISRYNLQK